MIFLKKNILLVILALFANFEAKRAGNGAKKRKVIIYERVLELHFATIPGSP